MSNLTESSALESSRKVYEQALRSFPPFAVVLAFSGGNDSLATYYAAKVLGIKIDYILHVNTRTGIAETTEYVRKFAASTGIPYLEADAGDKYEKRLFLRGFFGRGRHAHTLTYHILKKQQIRAALATIRRRKQNRNIWLLNGARVAESDNRAKNFAGKEIRRSDSKSSNIWVNLIHYWQKSHCSNLLADCKAPCNIVSRELCRSGECLCGSMQSVQARHEASVLFPAWGAWIDALEKKVMETFPWGWGEDIPVSWQLEQKGQLRLFPREDFQPMCSGCLSKDEQVSAGGMSSIGEVFGA